MREVMGKGQVTGSEVLDASTLLGTIVLNVVHVVHGKREFSFPRPYDIL